MEESKIRVLDIDGPESEATMSKEKVKGVPKKFAKSKSENITAKKNNFVGKKKDPPVK